MMIEYFPDDYKLYLFSELSRLAYASELSIMKRARELDFLSVNFYDIDGAQAYCFYDNDTLVVSCRGTETHDWNDIIANMQAYPVKTNNGGRVHAGFLREADKIWSVVKNELFSYDYKEVWFCGHSLGGAISTILAEKAAYELGHTSIKGLYTYGSPRVGWPKYVKSYPVKHCRCVNNNDIVVGVPLAIMGYRHHGRDYYINAYGNIRSMTFFQRVKDKFRGFYTKLKDGKFGSFYDHSIYEYVKYLKNNYQGIEHEQSLKILTEIKKTKVND